MKRKNKAIESIGSFSPASLRSHLQPLSCRIPNFIILFFSRSISDRGIISAIFAICTERGTDYAGYLVNCFSIKSAPLGLLPVLSFPVIEDRTSSTSSRCLCGTFSLGGGGSSYSFFSFFSFFGGCGRSA